MVRKYRKAETVGAIGLDISKNLFQLHGVDVEGIKPSLVQHRTGDLLVRQVTQTVNAIRAHLAEFGVVAPAGVRNIDRLLETAAQVLPEHAMEAVHVLAGQFNETRARPSEPRRVCWRLISLGVSERLCI